jgi:uncharacterized protein YkwD
MSRRSLTGLLLVCVLFGAERKDQRPHPPLGSSEKTIFDLTNKARIENKLPPLTVNSLLTKVARAHAANMASQGKMSHVLDDKTPADRVKDAGYNYSLSGENIALGENTPVSDIFEGWMKSKAHRENILREQFREVGVGVSSASDGKVYYTQEFGTPATD